MNTLRLNTYFERLQRWDLWCCLRLNRTSRNRNARQGFVLVSRLGDGVFWYGLMLTLLLTQGASAAVPVSQMLITGIVGTLLYKLLKLTTTRPRPNQIRPQIRLGTAALDRFSFPSGHTLHAVLFTVITLAWYPLLAPLLAPFTLLIATSRVILGLHYPSDVVAGALISAALAVLSLDVLEHCAALSL